MTSDLIIIGAGPGGYETAVQAAKAGLRTVVIEANQLGGTCLNVGCIPTKCLCRNAEFLRDLRQADALNVELSGFKFRLDEAIKRKDEVVSQLVGGIAGLLKHPNITLLTGKAEFLSKTTVKVNEEVCEAPNIIIATGSVSKMLPIPGIDLPCVLTSTEMLSLTQLPQRLCIVGGGVIGLEFASIFHSFGSEVTVVEFCKEILPQFDADIAKRLRMSLKSQGINIITGAAVSKISQDGHQQATVTYELKGEEVALETDIVLMAVGRAANVESLNLSDVGIAFDRRGIQVNDFMQTNIDGIYAIGDINGRCQLAHAAVFQGKRALHHILGHHQDDGLRLDLIPAAVFTHPEVASVGLTTEQAKAAGLNLKAYKGFFRSNGKALAMAEPEGMVKLLADESGVLRGAHLYGAHSADLVHEITTFMQKGGTLSDIANMVHAHPTLSEVILQAAEA